MQPEASNARQQLVERIRQSTNILIAVSSDPSVDALSSALGLALMLNKMDKHATAVFSGKVPPAIEFLQPGKTFEGNVDSLRDFIISLDKDKADRLRYKVEDDVVRIFITPYRTTITQKDLQFSQGDFNVELIIALDVEKKEDLDKAITAHARVLHDATVVTINSSAKRSSIGSLDWHDGDASCLGEMLVSLSESFQQPGLLDSQIATALLTGIVAATDRFSNQRTNPKVMTMSAQLMAAGANQQLISTNLTKSTAVPPPSSGQLSANGESVKIAAEPVEAPKKDGELDIAHKPEQLDATQKAEDELAAAMPSLAEPKPTFDQLKQDLNEETPPEQPKKQPFIGDNTRPGEVPVDMGDKSEPDDTGNYISAAGSWRGDKATEPKLGGTLNATTEQALEDTHHEEEERRNQTILSHDNKPTPPAVEKPVEAPEPEPTMPTEPVEQAPPIPSSDSGPEPMNPTLVEPDEQPEPLAMPNLPVVEPPAPGQIPVTPSLLPTPAPAPEPAVIPPAPLPEPPVVPPAPALPAEPALPLITPEPAGATGGEKVIMPPTLEPAPAVEMPAPAPAQEPIAPPPTPEAQEIDAARQAVDAAFGAAPYNPASEPPPLGAGSLPLGGPLNPPAPAPGDSAMPPLPPLPPLPDNGTALPPPPTFNDITTPPSPNLTPPPVIPPAEPTPPAGPPDPGQFKIPGQ